MKTNLRALLRSGKKRIDDYYDDWQERLRLGFSVGRLERSRVGRSKGELEVTGEGPAAALLVATDGQGLLMVEQDRVRRLFEGKFYGITHHRGCWYAFERQLWHGRIIRFSLDGEWEVAIWGLSRGVHQIDILDERLVVVDTYENRVLLFDNPAELKNVWWKSCKPAVSYPDGVLRQGRGSHNYHHFNSIFADDEAVYLLAHNETLKTSRPSEVWRLDRELATTSVTQLDASNAHNVYVHQQSLLCCASMEGTLQLDDQDVFKTQCFTRGLSVSADMIVMGGSDISRDRTQRSQTNGYVWTLTPGFQMVECLTIRGGPVQEIRRIDANDMAMLGAVT
jgi:hypothetical protein